MRKIITFLLFSIIAYAQINELNLIPAFYVNSEAQAKKLIELAKKKQFHPITYKDYVSGLIATPKHHSPFILFVADYTAPINFVESEQNFNLPVYHKDFDPVKTVKVSSLSGIDFNSWLFLNKNKELFISNGKKRIIAFPKPYEDQLFTYAPSDKMFKSSPRAFPFLYKKQRYYSKSERLKQKRYSLRGYHLSYGAIRTLDKINKHIDIIKSHNLDSVVIDYKSYFDNIQKKYKSYSEFMNTSDSEIYTQIISFQKIVKHFKDQNIKVSLRLVVATDKFIQQNYPDLMLWDRQTNQPWTDYFGQAWMDLYSTEVLTYYKKIIRIAAMLAPDEIQLDYLRFPSEGNTGAIQARHSNGEPRYKAVDRFCKEILPILDSANISFAVDIFGIVVWEKKETTRKLGQNILTFMRYADEICPMLYPSHFHSGFENIKAPGEMPYLLMLKGTQRFKKIIDQHPQYKVVMVPWIQAFKYLAPSYGPKYIQEQLRAIKETGMDGFLAWNARNDYKVLFNGLE